MTTAAISPARLFTRAKFHLTRDPSAQGAFFSTLALRLRWRDEESIETADVDGTTFRCNPTWWEKLSDKQRLGVLVHTVCHCAFQHHTRRLGRTPQRWNMACDLAVNSILKGTGYELPKKAPIPGEGKFKTLEDGQSAEHYYALLKDKQCGEPGDPDPGGCGAVRDAEQPSESAAQWSVALQQAAQVAKQRGNLPGNLAKEIESQAEPQIDWRVVLMRFMTSVAKDDYSWLRPNRRHVADGVYLPSLHSERVGSLVVMVDSSGSCWDGDVLAAFAAELKGILGVNPATVYVMYHDSVVQGEVEVYRDGDFPAKLTPRGGGGTDHRPCFAWVDANVPDVQAVICLTDLYTALPTTPPEHPVLWVAHRSQVAPPWGEVIRID